MYRNQPYKQHHAYANPAQNPQGPINPLMQNMPQPPQLQPQEIETMLHMLRQAGVLPNPNMLPAQPIHNTATMTPTISQGYTQAFGQQLNGANQPASYPDTSHEHSRYANKRTTEMVSDNSSGNLSNSHVQHTPPVENIVPMLGNEFEPLAGKNVLVEKQVMGDSFKYVIMGKITDTVLKPTENDSENIVVISDPITKKLANIPLTYDMKNTLTTSASAPALYQTIGITEHFSVTSRDIVVFNHIKTSDNMHELAASINGHCNQINISDEDKLYLKAVNDYLTKSVMLTIKIELNESEKITSFMEDYDDLIQIYKKAFIDNPDKFKRYEFSFEDILVRLKESVDTFMPVYDEAIVNSEDNLFKEGLIIDPVGYLVINTYDELVKVTILDLFKNLDGIKAIREDVTPALYRLVDEVYDIDISKLIVIVGDDVFLVKQTVSGYYTITKL